MIGVMKYAGKNIHKRHHILSEFLFENDQKNETFLWKKLTYNNLHTTFSHINWREHHIETVAPLHSPVRMEYA